jgi:3-oxoacyl-[acyl-carrier-protein] synthase II
VRGFGASADAVHLTAPDRQGGGVLRAARAALAEAGDPRVDLVSAHATATPFNDAAESRALAALGGDPIVHAFKAQVGHTLGAAGTLESLAALDAIRRGVLPATAGEGTMDPEAPARLLARTERGTPRVALKLASAFGGANAALVLSSEPGARPRRSVREAWVTRASRVSVPPDLDTLAAALAIPSDRLARADRHVLWALAAVAALAERVGRSALAGAGIVVGTAVATLETNAVFAQALRQRGARHVPPRLFPYTSPNAVAGECGIAFGLTGPSFSVGAGLGAGLEALAVGFTLVRAGDADRMVVVAVDDVGDVAGAWATALGVAMRPGAIALLVTPDRTPHAVARITSARVTLGPSAAPSPTSRGPVGHLALAPLASEAPPDHLEISSSLLGTIATARVDFSAN